MKRILLSALVILVSAASLADTLRFNVVGIDCGKCAPPVVKALNNIDGVKSAKVDIRTKSATVDVAPGFDRQRVRTALENAGFGVVFPGEKPRDIEPLAAEDLKSLDIASYTDGKRVDLARIMAPGKITIVDFYADWCGPCHVLEARLQHLMHGGNNLAMRRINIGKWDNDAAKQATELRAQALPYIRVYDARGNFVTAVTGGMWDEVLAAIAKAER
jgi:copper chaperone CopZ/thiol-disulfide isomerase/thioredoxin